LVKQNAVHVSKMLSSFQCMMCKIFHKKEEKATVNLPFDMKLLFQ